MTRAEDELYICGWKGSKAVDPGCWYELVHQAAGGWQVEEEKHVLLSSQTAAVKQEPAREAASHETTLPVWVSAAAANEPTPPRPLSPSRFEAATDVLPPQAATARERGILIHRLLQYLPEVAAGERRSILERFMKRYGTALPQEEQEHIAAEVLGILEHPAFAPVFAPGSVAEASIAGVTRRSSPLAIAGRIDRLAVLPQDVYIIDYKTGRSVPESSRQVPEAYLRQICAYRELVSEIYPDKTIHCAILWTSGPELMVLSEAELEALAA
jgi:ATP-dependent helicase/nuclease subunit A